LELKDAKPKGALVMKVDPDGPAASSELQPADVITEVEQKPVGTAAAAMSALVEARATNRAVHLTFERKGVRTSATIESRK
jgi:S1-C subfamily serine protease